MLTCNTFNSLNDQLNKSISSIGNNLLNNLRFDFNRPVDYNRFEKLKRYKEIIVYFKECTDCFSSEQKKKIEEQINTLTANKIIN